MPRDPSERICTECRRIIVKPSDHRACIDAIVARALAAGTHTNVHWHICGQCRQWVNSIYYVTPGGTRLCPACADTCGQGPIADEARLNVKPPRPRGVTPSPPQSGDNQYNAKAANQGRAVVAGKDARPQGRGGGTDAQTAARPGQEHRPGRLPPLSDEERRRRFPVAELQTVDW